MEKPAALRLVLCALIAMVVPQAALPAAAQVAEHPKERDVEPGSLPASADSPDATPPRTRDGIPRYEVFATPSYLNSSKLNLVQRGFNGEFGIHFNRWLTFGADYSIFKGHDGTGCPDCSEPQEK
jgi:hypothetical protein